MRAMALPLGRTGRRLWHMAAGSFFPLLALFLTRETVLPLVVMATTLALAGEAARWRWPRLNLWLVHRLGAILKEEESRRLTGASYLLFSTLLVFWWFPREIAVPALLFLSLGDPTAALVGERWGRRKLWGKSLEGSLACLLVALGVGGVLSPGLGISPLLMMVGAFSAALIEFLPLPLDDNLAIPPFSAGIMALGAWQGW